LIILAFLHTHVASCLNPKLNRQENNFPKGAQRIVSSAQLSFPGEKTIFEYG
jgi:hypothetical protein